MGSTAAVNKGETSYILIFILTAFIWCVNIMYNELLGVKTELYTNTPPRVKPQHINESLTAAALGNRHLIIPELRSGFPNTV